MERTDCVRKGGSWYNGSLKCTVGNSPLLYLNKVEQYNHIGFRIVFILENIDE